MINNKLPSIKDTLSKSREDRIIDYRKFFAELRLNRLYFHLTILSFFSNADRENNTQTFRNNLDAYLLFFENMDTWIENLRKSGIYDEFKEQCLEEIKVIEQIIQSYEGRIKR